MTTRILTEDEESLITKAITRVTSYTARLQGNPGERLRFRVSGGQREIAKLWLMIAGENRTLADDLIDRSFVTVADTGMNCAFDNVLRYEAPDPGADELLDTLVHELNACGGSDLRKAFIAFATHMQAGKPLPAAWKANRHAVVVSSAHLTAILDRLSENDDLADSHIVSEAYRALRAEMRKQLV
jgi:hypothetical protein